MSLDSLFQQILMSEQQVSDYTRQLHEGNIKTNQTNYSRQNQTVLFFSFN